MMRGFTEIPRRTVLVVLILLAGAAGGARAAVPPPTREQIEADWLRQVEARDGTRPVRPEEDAAGACDGVKNGRWGFHTDLENDPWWQIDLGQVRGIDHLLVFNRCDHTSGRAASLQVLLSKDGKDFRQVYRNPGVQFLGQPDGKPLRVSLGGQQARWIRLQVPGRNCLHLDEVEAFDRPGGTNLALGRPATQSSICEHSVRKKVPGQRRDYPIQQVLHRGLLLARNLQAQGGMVQEARHALEGLRQRWQALPADATENQRGQLFLDAHWAVRRLALANPLLDFKDLLFAASAPPRWSHMSDQYLGWWSQPGGGLFVLEDFRSEQPRLRCLTPQLPPGNVLRPDLSHDGRKVLFAWCRYHPGLSEKPDKLAKDKLPEDSFYHLFEMNVDGTGLRQLTFGKYNDFDGRYLPDGRIVFCSTRRGQAVQVSQETAQATLRWPALPESYVRCGGGPERPCAVYTLHVLDGPGSLRPISSFEMFEWTPSVDEQGRILYSRWDYVDRYGQNAMGLWSTLPDGTGARALYGNFTRNPECLFEPRSVPGSPRVLATASGHHSITAGSLVLVDPRLGPDEPRAITRLTPEVPFPESEGTPATYFANPWPLSEDHFLTAWSDRPLKFQGAVNDTAALGVYLFDAFGNLNLLYRDPAIGTQYPLPIRPRPRPRLVPDQVDWAGPAEGQVLVADVYRGLETTPRGAIQRLRVVGMPVKTHPTMDFPSIGLTTHDSGRYVLGTVPVEKDGSAFFRVPSGVTFFLQALDAEGKAVQTMRSGIYLQPGQTHACVGCHEQRTTAPPRTPPQAAARAASLLTPGPEGSWPLDYTTLVQPVLDRGCVGCHRPGEEGGKFDLTRGKSYESLVAYGSPSLKDVVLARYREQRSREGHCEAALNPVLKLIRQGHHGVQLTPGEWDRLVTWMDTLGQRAGHYSPEQAEQLRQLRERMSGLLGRRDR